MDPFWPTSVAQKRAYQEPTRRLAEEEGRATGALAAVVGTNHGRTEAMQEIAAQANAVRALRATRAEQARRRLAANAISEDVRRLEGERRAVPKVYPAVSPQLEREIADDVGGLPSVYQDQAEPIAIMPDDGRVPLRIIRGGDFVVYYSARVPVYLRYRNPSSPIACTLEYDAGLNGHRSEVAAGSSWLIGPEFGRIGLSQPSEINIRLDLTKVTIPGCVLGTPSWTQINRVWTLD
jgi:hypothetical protein